MDDLIAHARIVGERDADDGLRAVGPPLLVEHVGDGLGAEGAARVRVTNRRVERGGAVEIEEAEQTGGGAAEVSAVEGDLGEERLGRRANGEEPVALCGRQVA